MENLTGSSKESLHEFVFTLSDFSYVVHGTYLLVFAALLFVLSILYKNIRRKFPVSVNCWFCNQFTKVSYDDSNSWDCPSCKQYNGFNEDGGYNKVIKEQYNSKLNDDIFNSLKPSFSSNKYELKTNGFCKLCNINQQLKVQQLALFVPLDENNYNKEIEEYREKLEKAYKLCATCEKTLHGTLEKQKYNLLQDRLNSHKKSNLLQSPRDLNLNGKGFLLKIKADGFLWLRWISMVLAMLLFLALIIQFETENKFLYLTLPHFVILEPLGAISKVVLTYIRGIGSVAKELSFAGFLCSLLTHIERQEKKDHIALLAWGLFHILLWSSMTGFQLVLSGVCLYLNSQTIQSKMICLNKRTLPKKSGFQPVKQIFSDIYNASGEETQGTLPKKTHPAESLFGNDFESAPDYLVKENIKSPAATSGEKKPKHRRNEIEVSPTEEAETLHPKAADSSSGSKNTPGTSSIFNKQFLSTLEADKSEGEANESFGDVYNDLSGLRLGEKQKKSKKSSFLFTNHNFAEGSSIIKPAKLIKNLSSSWTWTESNECGSRSSTPSSGYSSQKAEKIEPPRYDFSKTLTPISINPFSRHSPQECFDYYGANNGFYNNFNYCSPGFVPFQQMHTPMGHTTIYTCTRPTNFSFPFPWQGFPSQKFSSPSPRFSDASDCDNLFQNISKSFEKKKKWFRLKSVLYYFSVFLNCVTFFGLIYCVSTGMILEDWKLPRLNFYL